MHIFERAEGDADGGHHHHEHHHEHVHARRRGHGAASDTNNSSSESESRISGSSGSSGSRGSNGAFQGSSCGGSVSDGGGGPGGRIAAAAAVVAGGEDRQEAGRTTTSKDEALRRDHLAFEVADIDAARIALEERGISCRVVEVDDYATQLFFEDCDGNMIEIGKYCPSPLHGSAESRRAGGIRGLAARVLAGASERCARAADALARQAQEVP